MKIALYILILKFIFISGGEKLNINASRKSLFVTRAISNNYVLIFHPEYSVIRKIGEGENVINKISNPPFLFNGTFYPITYSDNDGKLRYIISPSSTESPSKFRIYYNPDSSNENCMTENRCIKENLFQEIQFSKLTSLSPIDENQFFASYVNITNNRCEFAIFDLSSNSHILLSENLNEVCSNPDQLNVYYIDNQYIYIKSNSETVESGTFDNTTKTLNKSSNQIKLGNGCENLSQLQVIKMGNNKYMNCFLNSNNDNVCCATGSFENGIYNLGTFKSDITCSNSKYFSMNILNNGLLMIGYPLNADQRYNFILYSDDRRVRYDSVFGDLTHPSKDFTILPNKNVYFIQYHGTCDSLHEKEYTSSLIPSSNGNCTDKSINVRIQNTNDYVKINIQNEDPEKIYFNNSDCKSYLYNFQSSVYSSVSLRTQYIFDNIYISQKYGIDCSNSYYSNNANFNSNNMFGSNYKVYCYIDITSCDYSCVSCNPNSISETRMNCVECIPSSPASNYYIFQKYSDSEPLGNCCENKDPYCSEYDINCKCSGCKDGFDLIDSECQINIKDKKILMNEKQTKIIELFNYIEFYGLKIKITRNNNFLGTISIKNSLTNAYDIIAENIIETNDIEYYATKKGEYSFTYFIEKDGKILSNTALVKIFVCKAGCRCEETVEKYECRECDGDIICEDIKVLNFNQIVNTQVNIINFNDYIKPDEPDLLDDKLIYIIYDNESIKGNLTVHDAQNDSLKTGFYTKEQIINYIKDLRDVNGGTYNFDYMIVDSSKTTKQSNIGTVTLIVCNNYCACDSTNYCLECLPNYYSYVNNLGELTCLIQCQPEYRLVKNTYICKDKVICPNEIAYRLNEEEDGCILNEIEILIERMDRINTVIADLDRKLEDDKYILEVYYTDKPFDKNSSVSDIDFSQCESILKKKGFIEEDESLIIAKVDFLKPNTTTREVQYQVYTKDGKKVNLDYCKDINIEIIYPIDNGTDINYDLAKEMSKDNIDIYNISDPFFNDLCFPYAVNGKDITLEDRKKEFYQNVNICKDNCKFNKMNYATDTVSCNCDIDSRSFDLTRTNTETNKFNVKNLFGNKNGKFSIKKLFGKIAGDTNLKISKCLNLFLKASDLRYNIGFIFGSFINGTSIISIIHFLFYGFDGIISQIHKILQKNDNIDKLINENNDKYEKNELDPDSKDIFQKKMLSIRAKSSLQIIERKNLYENLPYNFAIRKDKRSFLKVFKHNFIEKYPLVRIFQKLSYFEIININLIVYLTHLEIMFSINGILYLIPQISKDYYGQLKFTVSLLYSFFSFILGMLIYKFLKSIVLFSPIMETFVYEMKNNKSLTILTGHYLKCVKIKLFIFLVINFFVTVFFWYYMTVFCIIYRYSQEKWFLRGWISFFYTFLYCLFFSFLFTLFRFSAFDLKSRNLYNISLFIRQLF